jgi:hypothetical protein
MRYLTLICDSCGRNWPAARVDCVYERLRIATDPCPVCGAYTLGLQEPRAKSSRRRIILVSSEPSPRIRAEHPAEFPAQVEIRRAAG